MNIFSPSPAGGGILPLRATAMATVTNLAMRGRKTRRMHVNEGYMFGIGLRCVEFHTKSLRINPGCPIER